MGLHRKAWASRRLRPRCLQAPQCRMSAATPCRRIPPSALLFADRVEVAVQSGDTVGVEIGDDLAADQIAQRLRRATAERAVARAAIKPRYEILVGEAIAAVKLHRLVGDADGHLVAEDLRRRRQERIGEGVRGGTGAIKQAASRL